jgi:hypothetical protein
VKQDSEIAPRRRAGGHGVKSFELKNSLISAPQLCASVVNIFHRKPRITSTLKRHGIRYFLQRFGYLGCR